MMNYYYYLECIYSGELLRKTIVYLFISVVIIKDVSDIHMAFDRRLAREIVDHVLREAKDI